MEFNDRRPKGDRYVVLTQHENKDRVVKTKRKGFDVWEDAQEHAANNTPMTDGTMLPNIDQAVVDKSRTHEFASFGRWAGNKHAAILQHKQMMGRYRDSD